MTARLHRREPLFTPELRTLVVRRLRGAVAFSDVTLFAYVIMPNHLHLVARQGRAPMHRFMQPFLRSVALVVQRWYGREGHVFERRYRDTICADPDHFRNAITYTHLNPVRAGLGARPADYAWSSHGAWAGGEVAAVDGGPHPVALDHAAQVFAQSEGRTATELRRDYLAFQQWREARDRMAGSDAIDGMPEGEPPEPNVGPGNENWLCHLMPSGSAMGEHGVVGSAPAHGCRTPRPQLVAIATAVLNDSEPGLLASLVRSRWGGPPYVRARHSIIRRAAAAGYRGVEIAAFLRISDSTVSDVLTSDRKRLLKSMT